MASLHLLTVMACFAAISENTQGATIIFPTTFTNVRERNATLPQLVFTEEPQCANESAFGLCEESSVPYPSDVIKDALASNNAAAAAELTRGDDALLTLVNRFGSGTRDDSILVEETAACVATEAIIYPKMAKNDKNEWLFVVNSGQATQGIRVEKCVDEGRPCKVGVEGTVCRQKYIYRKMLAVVASGKVAASNFRIPSCCVCYIKNDFLQNRINSRPRKAQDPLATTTTKSPQKPLVKRRQRRQTATEPELQLIGGETTGLSGSPLEDGLGLDRRPQQGTAQQSIETEQTFNPSDTIGGLPFGRYAGEIIVHSQPIVVEKRPKQQKRRN